VMAVSMLPGVLTVLFSQEPFQRAIAPSKNMGEWLRGALVEPFADFIGRYRWQAALILGLIATYRISDVVMGIMANPFYVDMGFSKDEVAAVTKVRGSDDFGGRLCWWRLVFAHGCDAGVDARRDFERRQQFVVCMAEYPWT